MSDGVGEIELFRTIVEAGGISAAALAQTLNEKFAAITDANIAVFPPPAVQGRRLKLRYITQANARPPTFVVFGTRAEATPEDYRRYLVNTLREVFELPGVPLRIDFRGSVNPYADGERD